MTGHTDQELKALAPIVAQMPRPQDLRAAVRRALEEGYQAARVAQGTVTMPADTFALQRALAGVHETFTDYAAAFRDAAKRVAGMQCEQLIDAVGEQDGTPNQGLTIPDADGDVVLSLDTPKSYTFDLEQIIAVVTSEHSAGFNVSEEYRAGLEELMKGAIYRMLLLGKFEPQVTKVTAYAKELARQGLDGLSAVVSSAMRSTTDYKGVKFTRKATK